MKKVPVLCTGLNILRCFTDSNVPTIVVAYDPKDPALHSRYCQQKIIIDSSGKDRGRIVDKLLEMGKKFKEKPVLLYGDDNMLLLISRNRESLAKFYRFLMPAPESVEDFVDKTRFNSIANRLDIPVPETVLSSQVKDIEGVKEYLSPPYLLKPNSHVGWHQSAVVREETKGQPQKGLLANSDEDLERIFCLMKRFTDDFVVQEFVPGGEDLIYSFHAYYNSESEPLAYYVGKKIRTYPRIGGESCYLELVKEPEIVHLGMDILKKLKFVGPVKVDFKKDVRRNRFYLLEVNARFNLWHYLGSVSGINIPKLAYEDLSGQYVTPQKNYRVDIKWLAFGMDFRAFIKSYRPSGELSWIRWLISLRGKKVYTFFSWRDPCPFIFNLFNDLKKRVVKVTKGLSG